MGGKWELLLYECNINMISEFNKKKEADLSDLSEINRTKYYCDSYQIHQINPLPFFTLNLR